MQLFQVKSHTSYKKNPILIYVAWRLSFIYTAYIFYMSIVGGSKIVIASDCFSVIVVDIIIHNLKRISTPRQLRDERIWTLTVYLRESKAFLSPD